MEQKLVTVLFGNMFMSGLAIGMIRVCAFTLFLDHFASDQLAIVAILLAVTGTLVTVIIDKGTQGKSTRRYVFTILFTIFSVLLLIRGMLEGITNTTLIFALPLFFEIIYMLFSLQFVALLTRLLNVRQTKRLSGICRSGEFLAEVVGGISVAMLLTVMDIKDLLLVAAIAVLGVIAIVQWTTQTFSESLSHHLDTDSKQDSSNKMMSLLKLPYVRMIGFCYMAFIFAYFFLDVAFYSYASRQFPLDAELATFIGQFFAMSGLLTLIAMVFLFAPFLRKFGILAGIVAFPLVIFFGASSIGLLEVSKVEVGVIFAVMVVTNCLRFILQSSIWRPTVGILFQVLPSRQRTSGTALIEGIIDPFSGGLAGLCLYFVSEQLGWGPDRYLLLLAGLMLVWFGVGFTIRKNYLNHLVDSIKKRKLGEVSIAELDQSAMGIIIKGLTSGYPSEVYYCLGLLEELEDPDLHLHLRQTLNHPNAEIRLDVLHRISRLSTKHAIKTLAIDLRQLIEFEADNAVLGQALNTYAIIEPDLAPALLHNYLSHLNPQVRKGAMVGLLNLHDFEQKYAKQARDSLKKAVRSEILENRLFAAGVLGQVKNKIHAPILVELIEDVNSDVTEMAIKAAGAMRANQVANLLINKLKTKPDLHRHINSTLRQMGSAAIGDINGALSSDGTPRRVRTKLIQIIKDIGGTKAQQCLLSHINMPQPELRHQVFIGLSQSNYQVPADDRYKFVGLLSDEISEITWLLATNQDLAGQSKYVEVQAAIGQELNNHKDRVLLLVSFIFNSHVILNSRANIDSKVPDLRVFALEVLDNLLSREIKPIVMPLLDELSHSERLNLLDEYFPQQRMTADARFEEVMAEYFHRGSFWMRASLVHHIGKHRITKYAEQVLQACEDTEALVRETALWSLNQIESDEVQNRLTIAGNDASSEVRQVAEYLLNFQTQVVNN